MLKKAINLVVFQTHRRLITTSVVDVVGILTKLIVLFWNILSTQQQQEQEQSSKMPLPKDISTMFDTVYDCGKMSFKEAINVLDLTADGMRVNVTDQNARLVVLSQILDTEADDVYLKVWFKEITCGAFSGFNVSFSMDGILIYDRVIYQIQGRDDFSKTRIISNVYDYTKNILKKQKEIIKKQKKLNNKIKNVNVILYQSKMNTNCINEIMSFY